MNHLHVLMTACRGRGRAMLRHAPYLLFLLLIAFRGQAQINETFDDLPNAGLPAGWTSSGLPSGSSRGCTAPAPCFNANGQYLVTPAITNPNQLTFSTIRSSNTAAWSMDVQISAQGSATGWTTVYSVTSASSSCSSVGPISLSGYTGVRYVRFIDTRPSGAPERNIDNVVITVASPAIALSSSSPAVPAGPVYRGSTSNILYRFQTAVTVAATTLNSVTFNTGGSYTAADIVNYRLWYNTSNSFAGATQVGNTITTGLGVGSHTFTSVARSIASGTTGYFWITADLQPTAVINNTISVNAITTGNLSFSSGTVTGATSAGAAQTILAQPGATTIDAGTVAAPAVISSLLTLQANAAINFSFQITDDSGASATDTLPTRISDIVIGQGTGNTVSNWSQAIAGAELSDGVSSRAGTIGTGSITFSSLPNDAGELGHVPDDSSKPYTLKIWLRSALGGTLPATIDGQRFVFRVQTAGVTPLTTGSSNLALSQDQNSGAGNNIVDVTATQLSFVQQPTDAGLNMVMTPAVTVQATDSNRNRDLDYTATVNVSSTGTLSGASTTAMAAASGLATFGNLVHAVLDSNRTLTATDGILPAVVSDSFHILLLSAATDHFRSESTGAWNNAATWSSSADSVTWIPATLVPNQNAADIVISSGDTVTINATGTVLDQTYIKDGGYLAIAASYMINNGAGDDLSIERGGTLLIYTENTPGSTGNIRVHSGGTIAALSAASGTTLVNSYLSASATRVFYEDSAIFDCRLTTTNPTVSGATYFNTGIADMPILRITSLGTPTNFGGASATTINGRIEANTNFTFAGSGAKTVRGGFSGTGTVSMTAALTFTSASSIIGGDVTLNLTSLTLQNGATVPAGAQPSIPSGTITKSAGTFTVDGSLDLGIATMTNPSGGVVINGTLRTANPNGLSGASNSTFINGAGTVTLSPGSIIQYAAAAQTISGRTDYTDLMLSGAGAKTLSGPVTVNGTLTMGSGLLSLGSYDLTAGAITGASAAGYVRTNGAGRLKRTVTAGSTTEFPVGNSAYNPARITGNSATTGIFAVGVTDDVLDAGSSGSTITTSPSILRTWHIGGTGDVDLTLQWNAGEENMAAPAFDYNHAYVAHYDSVSGRWENYLPSSILSGPPAGNGPYTVTQTGITRFSPFTVASGGVNPLPVQLVRFSATSRGMRNELEWETATETGGDAFIIERSADGISFSAIGQVNAAGKGMRYHFDDERPLGGDSYYRLKISAANGGARCSNTVLVSRTSGEDLQVSIYPNPVQQQLTVSGSGTVSGPAELKLTGPDGHTLIRLGVQALPVRMDLQRIPAGTYLLHYTDQQRRITRQIIKQ